MNGFQKHNKKKHKPANGLSIDFKEDAFPTFSALDGSIEYVRHQIGFYYEFCVRIQILRSIGLRVGEHIKKLIVYKLKTNPFMGVKTNQLIFTGSFYIFCDIDEGFRYIRSESQIRREVSPLGSRSQV